MRFSYVSLSLNREGIKALQKSMLQKDAFLFRLLSYIQREDCWTVPSGQLEIDHKTGCLASNHLKRLFCPNFSNSSPVLLTWWCCSMHWDSGRLRPARFVGAEKSLRLKELLKVDISHTLILLSPKKMFYNPYTHFFASIKDLHLCWGFVTRVYNDIIPGPTIVVQPGDRWTTVHA